MKDKKLRKLITKKRQKIWNEISYLTIASIMVMIKNSLDKNHWAKKIIKKDLKTISKLSIQKMEIRIEDIDFLEW